MNTPHTYPHHLEGRVLLLHSQDVDGLDNAGVGAYLDLVWMTFGNKGDCLPGLR